MCGKEERTIVGKKRTEETTNGEPEEKRMLEQYQAKKEEDAENSLKTRKRANKSKMTVSWWNGGGKLIPSLKVNPELSKYLDTNPDIFAHGEALIF